MNQQNSTVHNVLIDKLMTDHPIKNHNIWLVNLKLGIMCWCVFRRGLSPEEYEASVIAVKLEIRKLKCVVI